MANTAHGQYQQGRCERLRLRRARVWDSRLSLQLALMVLSSQKRVFRGVGFWAGAFDKHAGKGEQGERAEEE